MFKEIKKQRQNGAEIDITIDGSSGKEIPQTFARVYEDLYNNSNDDDEIEKLESQLNKNLRNGDKGELEKMFQKNPGRSIKRRLVPKDIQKPE